MENIKVLMHRVTVGTNKPSEATELNYTASNQGAINDLNGIVTLLAQAIGGKVTGTDTRKTITSGNVKVEYYIEERTK